MSGAMSKMVLVIVTAAMMSLSGTLALSAESNSAPDVRERAEQAIKEGAEKIMRALQLILLAVPQYEMPEVLDNGDIIIRRLNPDRPKHPGPPSRPRDGTDETAT